jgi:hypothetical protein
LRTPLIIALAATLVGCSRQPPHQAAVESCTDKHGFGCSSRTAADQPIKLASFKPNRRLKSAKFAVAATAEKPSPRGARDRGPAHLATKEAKPTVTAAKAKPRATGVPLPPSPLKTEREPISSAASAVGSGTTGLSVADPPPTASPAPNSNSRTIQEQVTAATAVAERMTVATATAARAGADPIAGAPDNTESLVAIVIVRPEIPSVFFLTAKNVAIDDRYSASIADIRIAIAAADGPVVQLSAGHTAAIDRLINGEVPAAVLALVSSDAAEAFPEIKGFKIFHIPLSSRYLKPRP